MILGLDFQTVRAKNFSAAFKLTLKYLLPNSKDKRLNECTQPEPCSIFLKTAVGSFRGNINNETDDHDDEHNSRQTTTC